MGSRALKTLTNYRDWESVITITTGTWNYPECSFLFLKSLLL